MTINRNIDITIKKIKNWVIALLDTKNSTLNDPDCVDVLSWAVLALELSGEDPLIIKNACRLIVHNQLPDGRVVLRQDQPEAFWPTALALLVWRKKAEFLSFSLRASEFLLSVSGLHPPKGSYPETTHDLSLKGWPWTGGTHSWIVPTSLAVFALSALGYHNHERVIEGKKMILNRQLPHGGWNYGNTRVFDVDLFPSLDETGLALNALIDFVKEENIQGSMAFLQGKVSQVNTPLSLSWALLGLSAWGKRPKEAEQWIHNSIRAQEQRGPYSIDLLSQLVVAFYAQKGFITMIRDLEQ
jgi:hypothetical protein